MVSNQVNYDDASSLTSHINTLRWTISGLNIKKREARSVNEFYTYGKMIRAKKMDIFYALTKYKELEIKNNLPINLEYRAALKHLRKNDFK